MEWYVWALLFGGFAFGLLAGGLFVAIRHRISIPYAGNVIVDMRRDCDDAIRIESHRRLSHWQKYKHLKFDVVVMYDKPVNQVINLQHNDFTTRI